MKKICLLLSVVLLFSALTGCTAGGRRNASAELPPSAFIDRMFSADENVYAIRSAGGYAYITTAFSNGSVCYPISKLRSGQYSDAIWHEQSRRLYYSEGYRVYSSDLTGNEKRMVWELPEGTKKDFVRIAAVADDCLLIECGYGERQSAFQSASDKYVYKTYGYFSLNVTTFEAISVLREVPSYKLPVVICSHENTVFAVQPAGRDQYEPILVNEIRSEEAASVLRIDLLSGSVEALGVFSVAGTVSYADGAVFDGSLYFLCEGAGLYSMALSGGGIERLHPDTARVPGMDRYIRMAEYNGDLFILMWDGATYPPSALCRWEQETDMLLPVAITDGTFSAKDFFIDREMYFLYAGDEILSGKLVEPSFEMKKPAS